MTIAIVDLTTGQFKHTTNKPVVEIDGINRRTDSEDRKQYGIFDFIPASGETPAGKKPQGMTFSVDLDAGVVTETFIYVDMTPDEIKQATNGPLDAQIVALEAQNLYNRGSRTIDLSAMEKEAARQLYGYEIVDGVVRDKQLTPEQTTEIQAALYAGNPGYKRVKDLDDQIAALRAQRI